MSKTFRARAAALVLAAALGAAAAFTDFEAEASVPPASPAPQATPAPDAITFHNNTLTDFSATSGEPIIKVDPKDRIFVTTPFGLTTTLSLLWRSDDGGRSFIPLGGPAPRDAVLGPGGGDTDVDFDDKGRLYYVDLSAACVTAAVSEDGGNTFPADRTTHITCVSDDNPEAAIDDRQWIVGFGDGTAYATWRNFQGGNFWMFKTSDAGRTWDKGRLLGSVGQSGPLRIDKKKRRVNVGGVEKDAVLVYQIYYTGNNVRLFRVTDVEGGTPVVENFSIYQGSSGVSNVFPVLAVDTAGNLYAAWSQVGGAAGTSHTVWMATSTDRGATWSPRKQVSTFTGTNIMPWIVAGDPGRLDVVWYRGSQPNNPNSLANEWQIYMAQTLNAFDAAPTFTTVPVSQNVVHRGEICTAGVACDATGRDRSFLEYPSIWLDSKGAAVVVYNDNTNQSEGPYVMTAKQATGPSLYASAGTLGREPGAVAVSAPTAGAQVTADTLTLEGTHTVPPKNFDRDEAGDARYRPTGANLPGADIRSVALSEQGDTLVLRMQVADLSPAAINAAATASEGTGVLYLTQWDYADTIYWLAAEVNGATTNFYTGTLGMIRSATSKKFVTYNPDLVKSQSVKGQLEGNTITISVPKVTVGSPIGGAPFHSVTAFALSERAPLLPVGADLPNAPAPAPKTTSLLPDPTSLPLLLDASGAATYTAGDGGPLTNGVVEVSLDDPAFQSPRVAALSPDPGSNRWQLALSASELVPGAHTAYVRQRIDGRAASAVVAVAFNVSDKVERDVTSLVTLDARNTSALGGVVAYDLLLRNASAQTVFTPLAARVSRLVSASGGVTVANADNGQTGAGAFFGYDSLVGGDGALSSGETTAPRRLRFNNPSNEPFTVEFQIVGQLPRGSGGAAATTSGTNTSGGTSGSTGTNSTSAGALVTSVLRVTYNPLLGGVRVEPLK
ncbi:MAG TPA: hypothetical protein VFZ44_04520 [Pyrinomonadaceae bacterium]